MKNLIFLGLGIIFLGLVSCTEESIESNDLQNGDKLKFVPTKGADPEFNIENGVFNFSSSEAAFATVNYFNSLSPDELLKWSKDHNFVTQKVLFEKVVKAESELHDGFETMSEAELKALTPDKYHSSIYKKMIEANVIREVFNEEGELDKYDYATFNPFIAGILNEDGVYKVRDDIIYVDGQYMKKWTNGNLSELNILKSVIESDSLKNIEILYKATSQSNLRSSYCYTCEPLETKIVYANNQNQFVDKSDATRRYSIYFYFGIVEWGNGFGSGNDGLKALHYLRFISEKKITVFGLGNFGYGYRDININYYGGWHTVITYKTQGDSNLKLWDQTHSDASVFSGHNIVVALKLGQDGHSTVGYDFENQSQIEGSADYSYVLSSSDRISNFAMYFYHQASFDSSPLVIMQSQYVESATWEPLPWEPLPWEWYIYPY